MTQDRIVEYLRWRGRAEPPVTLVPSILGAIDGAPTARSWFAAHLRVVAAAGAVVLVAVAALLLGQSPNVGPPPPSSSTPVEATPAEMRDAVERAVETLLESPGVRGVQSTSILGELAVVRWIDHRRNGDQVLVQRTDLDVAETGWWLIPDSEPPATGRNVLTYIWVTAGETFHWARIPVWDEGPAWVLTDLDELPNRTPAEAGAAAAPAAAARAAAQGVLLLGPNPLELLVEDGTVERQDRADGGVVWTMTSPHRDGTYEQEWRVGPSGELEAWSWDLVDVTAIPEDRPYTSGQVTFTVMSDPEPITPPDTDAAPDPADFGLPEDFPLGAG
ncbi:MAG TPA: hypothetical protein VGB34_05260 [Candidatus Limnocylindria bacterium]